MIWLNNKANMPNVNLFINDNYYLYNNFLGWKIYKKNNKN